MRAPARNKYARDYGQQIRLPRTDGRRASARRCAAMLLWGRRCRSCDVSPERPPCVSVHDSGRDPIARDAGCVRTRRGDLVEAGHDVRIVSREDRAIETCCHARRDERSGRVGDCRTASATWIGTRDSADVEVNAYESPACWECLALLALAVPLPHVDEVRDDGPLGRSGAGREGGDDGALAALRQESEDRQPEFRPQRFGRARTSTSRRRRGK